MITTEIQKTRACVDAMLADSALLANVQRVADVCEAALRGGNKILFCGNGGSAADAQHLSAELVSRLNFSRPGLSAMALTVDTSALTAIANDYGYESVFSRQIEAVGNAGDVLITISTSGNSPSVIRAIEVAKQKKLVTIGKTSRTGGKMAGMCDVMLHMPSDETPKVQECHMMLGHIYCALIEQRMFGELRLHAREAI